MKVQFLNSSSIKTRELIKKTFAELINEKKQLDKITVTELVKRANITRSTFYTHYGNIYEVAQDYQLQTIELLGADNLEFHSKNDIYTYFENIIQSLKDNEKIYKLLLSANESVIFLNRLQRIVSNKLFCALKHTSTSRYLELNISFFMNGIMIEILNYFRNKSDYSLDELLLNMKIIFEKIFYK